MAFRERRAALQKRLQEDSKGTVISCSMNIPGPVKTNKSIRRAFTAGKEELLKQLRARNIRTGSAMEIHEPCGDEYIVAVHAEAQEVKDITTQIEETHPFGRLFDMDVIAPDGNKLSREVFRKCLICGRQAQDCARARRHSVEEMQEAVEKILEGPLTSAQIR